MHLPSVNINAKSRIVMRRVLPVAGDVLVQPGQPVSALTVVAHGETPGRLRIINVARQLGLPEGGSLKMDSVAQVDIGDYVVQYDILARHKGPASLLEKTVLSPADGIVVAIGPGWIVLETERKHTEIQAFLNGVVTRLVPNRGAIIEANGALIEAACGFGGEAYGRLKRVVNSPYDVLTPDMFDESAGEAIVIGGKTLHEEALYAAEDWQVRGIIVGSIPANLMQHAASLQVRVVATEGFGSVPMSPHTFGLLISLSRREVSIRGQMPLPPGQKAENPLAGEPSLIVAADPLASRGGYVSLPAAPKKRAHDAANDLPAVGSKVRVIQGKYMGNSGVIDLIPPEPQKTENGIISPGAFVKFTNDVHFIPWANLQLIV